MLRLLRGSLSLRMIGQQLGRRQPIRHLVTLRPLMALASLVWTRA